MGKPMLERGGRGALAIEKLDNLLKNFFWGGGVVLILGLFDRNSRLTVMKHLTHNMLKIWSISLRFFTSVCHTVCDHRITFEGILHNGAKITRPILTV